MLEIALCNLQYTLIETVSAVSILLTSLTFMGFNFSYHSSFVSILFLWLLNCVCSADDSSIILILRGQRAEKGGRLCLFGICFLLPIFDIITLFCSELKLRIKSYFNTILKLIPFTFLIDYFVLSGLEFTRNITISLGWTCLP